MERDGDGERRRWREKEVVTSLMNEMIHVAHTNFSCEKSQPKQKKNTRGKRSRADDTVSLGTATFLEQAIQKFIEVFFEQKFFFLSKRRPVSIKN